jgi:replicative DNA helicase
MSGFKANHELQPRLVVIDGAYESRAVWQPSASRLRLWAARMRVAIIVTSRVPMAPSRALPSPRLGELRHPIGAADEVDLIVALHRHDAHGGIWDSAAAELDLLLHRGGPTARIPLSFSGFYARFDNYPGHA